MKHFKLPLIVSGVVFALILIVGIIGMSMILNSSGSNSRKAERASMLGGGIATLGCVIVAPFWFYSAAKLGKERRENLKKPKKSSRRKRTINE